MRRWGFWDWMGYGSIAFAAIIEALIETSKRTEMSRMFTDLSPFFTSHNWAFAPLILVVFATIVFLGKEFRLIGTYYYVGQTSITAQINAANLGVTFPERSNIASAYFFHSELAVRVPSGQLYNARDWAAFLIFDHPIQSNQIIAEGVSSTIPTYEIKQASPWHAIIGFHGDIAGMTVTIRTIS